MTHEAIIKKTLKTLNVLPAEKAAEVSDFAEYILKKYEEDILQKGIETIVNESEVFNFLNEEEDLYGVNDIVEKY